MIDERLGAFGRRVLAHVSHVLTLMRSCVISHGLSPCICYEFTRAPGRELLTHDGGPETRVTAYTPHTTLRLFDRLAIDPRASASWRVRGRT